ncbi:MULTISPECIES: ATP-dependent helicase HrpB [Marivita]|uniref:ATP-dependent helicase HrpB n=1 Tax=Marivita cryptomonadis TaxID=505252 RepID=A0A9Q2P6V5_9RHOB|nr:MULTISPECIES: ATP-dependent helicase HrpB [Marivita]MCR9168499.1 ATP-dependent helicase HrpB [Paracoccaceae bacterium]MBM2320082.1 ATP-dependent helicase HrpB [Marivita cryptomonadis]MBM2329661.1 ATP-dependent helicase HrpB [Marivita cryptomonadis]MBM2339249.1 ATP-dependent helicase HrpB [Marivita cryptomonadis]MBM2343907.1 ATP-dependent helicase HrpB [Marivita cryptomonadis]
MTRLPIDPVLPELIAHLRDHGRAVLQAPPGAGKTTRVPLAMLDAGLTTQRIVMLEPRRLAARAAAERMAESLGETAGQTVGYRVRGDSKVSAKTRIEVVTEGILTRMIQSDPELSGIGAVIFDEFHERSLNGDLGLALCLEIRGVLREDLILLAMSATLDAEPVARLMSAPIVTSEGRSFPVETRWLDKPISKSIRFENAMADLISHATKATEGGVLAFLPGEGEIRRVQAALAGRLPKDCQLQPLFGALPFKAQQEAIRPQRLGRKVVLATSIAETSLTIEDIRVVVDGGLARRSRFDPGSGMSRLVTEKVTKAEATQRAGRAGRVAEGVAFRLWTKGEDGALDAFPPAEIEAADLAGLVLELALWGAQPGDLSFLTPPPEGAFAEARSLLRMLGALDRENRITEHGRTLAALPLHPRLAHMIGIAGQDAAPLAALLSNRDPVQGAGVDLALRIEALRAQARFEERRNAVLNRGAMDRIRDEAKRLTRAAPKTGASELSIAEMTALAYPDRIGLRRNGDAPRYQLSGGKGAVMDSTDALAGARLIVATDLDGNPREARIRQAIQISESAVRALFPDQIAWVDICEWSKRERRVVARQQEKLGAIALDDRVWKDAAAEQIALAMLDGVRDLGLPPAMSDAARRFTARVRLGCAAGMALPDMSDPALMSSLGTWLLPHLGSVRSADDWKRFDLLPALRAMLDWGQMQDLDRLVPGKFTTPLGREIPIDYSGEHPEISLRLQELFGQKTHPRVGKTPLRVTLLSPAHRPVQTTLDLPGFWAGSYADVRKDMRAAYPKHPWPEDPTQADPTLRAKRKHKT